MGRNLDKYDFDKVDPSNKKFFPTGKSPLSFTRIFIPVYNNGIHWSHVVVDLRRFSVTHYDSGREYNSNSAKIVRGISKFLYACDKSKTMFAESKLELIQSHRVPVFQQKNTYDCGIFMLMFCEAIYLQSYDQNFCFHPS